MKKQLIQVYNPIGHGGNFFAGSLMEGLGYDYCWIKPADSEWFYTPNYESKKHYLGHAMKLLALMLDPYAFEHKEGDSVIGAVHGFQAVVDRIQYCIDKEKFVFDNDVHTAIIQNEFWLPFTSTNTKPNFQTFIIDADSYLYKHGIVRKDLHSPQQTFADMQKRVLYSNDTPYGKVGFHSKINPPSVVVNMQRAIFENGYIEKTVAPHLFESDKLNTDVMRERLLKWHQFMIAKA